MFRSIQARVSKRLESLKEKTQTQTELEKVIRSFLVGEFGSLGETLTFNVSQENKKLHLRFKSKTAANEVVLRSKKLKEALRTHDATIDSIHVD